LNYLFGLFCAMWQQTVCTTATKILVLYWVQHLHRMRLTGPKKRSEFEPPL